MLKRVLGYQDKPVDYLAQVLGIKHVWRKKGDLDKFPGEPAIWSLQEDLLNACPRAIKERKAIYCGSGHSCGKDFIAAAIGLWFLQTRMPSIVVLTGPTSRQVEDIMWKETLGHWERKVINLGGHAMTSPRLDIDTDWYMVGFTTKESKGSKEAGGAKFQGFKGKDNICVIVTEPQAVEDVIYDQIDAITTGANVLVVFIGNPTRASGRFAKGLKDKKTNIVFNISCLENPNYLERRTVIPGLASFAWVEDKRTKWGEDDPRWIGRVEGKLPDGTTNRVFSDELLNHMTSRHGLLSTYSDVRGVALDPAGEGVDDNVFMSGSGGEVIETFMKTRMSPSDTAIKAIEMCKRINGNFVIVDVDGLGQRDYAELVKLPRDYKQGIQIVPFAGSNASDVVMVLPNGKEKKLYGNLRAEAAFAAQERAKAGRAGLDPKAEELKEDLEADMWFEKNGVIYLLDKDDIRLLLDRSPGQGDAYKMLQWATKKNFRKEPGNWDGGGNSLPTTAIMDDTPPVSVKDLRNLPRQAQMD